MATKKKAARTAGQLAYDKRRAAAKKAAAKAPAKKATKRVVAKKVSPLKGRKLGPRKPKAASVVEENLKDVQAAAELKASEVGSVSAGVEEGANQEEQRDPFTTVECIDLRGLDIPGKFAVVSALEARGFIYGDTTELFDRDNLHTIFGVEALQLNQQNKLVRSMPADDIRRFAFVSRPAIEMEISVELTDPAPSLPSTLEVHGATYLRIG